MKAKKRVGKEMIPVGKDGKVPYSAIVQRYQEVGSTRDARTSSRKVLPKDVTPSEIEDWWNDPSLCDIEGVDTEDSDIYSVPITIRGKKRAALSKVAVLADKKESDRIKKILADSFTADELTKMTSDTSFLIELEDDLHDCTGFYLRKQEGYPVPRIILERGTSPDGIVHEAVHHLRAVEGRQSFPTKKNGSLDPNYRKLSKSKKDKIVTREETETVAETVARTRLDRNESGYYTYVPDETARKAYLHDRKVISGSKALKGKAAKKAVEKNYESTSISRAIISANKRKRR